MLLPLVPQTGGLGFGGASVPFFGRQARPMSANGLGRFAPVLFGLRAADLRGVVFRVSHRVNDHQVFDAVVRAVVIDVVDVFVHLKKAANVLLHQVPVLKHVTAIRGRARVIGHPQQDVAEIVHVPAFAALHSFRVVPADEATRNPGDDAAREVGLRRDGRHLTASAFALFRGRIFGAFGFAHRDVGVPSRLRLMAGQVFRAPISMLRTPGDRLIAAALAQEGFRLVTAQEVRRRVPEEVLCGDLFSAPTGTKGRLFHASTISHTG